MNIKILISSAIVSAIITVIGSIITTVITQRNAKAIAKDAAAQELQKMERAWEREDIVSSEDEFAEMADSVARFVRCGTPKYQSEAMGKVAFVRSKEQAALGMLLDDLYECIRNNNQEKTNEALSEAIWKKRNIKRDLKKGNSKN